jgi:cell division inhibitor SulA
MQSDLLSQGNTADKLNPFEGLLEKTEPGSVTEITLLAGNTFLEPLQSLLHAISRQEQSRWLTVLGPKPIIETLSANKPGNLLLLPANTNNEAFSVAQKALGGGQSSWVMAFMSVESLSQQLALQEAARKGSAVGLVLKTR